MRIKIGEKQLILFELEVQAETKVSTHEAFNSFSFLNATCKTELIGLMVATGLCMDREHALCWINSPRYGGGGDLEKAKSRACGYYRSKHNLK